MWLGGQQKQPADSGEGQIGIVTMSGGEMAVLLDCERRGVQVYSPGGYSWAPRVGQRVMVIEGQGEIPCIVGARQGQASPTQVGIQAHQAVNIMGAMVRLDGQVYVNGQTLEELIEEIVRRVMGGG